MREEASKSTSLAAVLEQAQAEVSRLTEEAMDGALESATLAADLESAQASVEELETDAYNMTTTNNDHYAEARRAKTQLENALKEKAAELESTLVGQKAELEEIYVAELDTTMAEEVGKLAADYKAQLPGIRDEPGSLDGKQP